MALTSTFTTISAGQTDANSPLDEVLMDSIRQDIDVLYEWMGGPTYTPSTSHDHDGINSKQVNVIASFASASTGNYVEGYCGLPSTLIGDPTASYTEALSMIVPRAGTYKIRYGAKEESAGNNVRIKLYRNGSAIGVERDLGTDAAWHWYNDNLSVSSSDIVSVYMKRGGSTGERASAAMAVMSGNPILPSAKYEDIHPLRVASSLATSIYPPSTVAV